MTSHQAANCSIRPEVPELYFCPDMKGYGWCFRKQNFLNVGLGRLDPHGLPRYVGDFVEFLKSNRKIGFELPAPMQGHAYLLYGGNKRTIVGDGILLVGDAAGVAYSQSGEGIRPAIESGLLAASAIIAAWRKVHSYRFGELPQSPYGAVGRIQGGLVGHHRPPPSHSLDQFVSQVPAGKQVVFTARGPRPLVPAPQ